MADERDTRTLDTISRQCAEISRRVKSTSDRLEILERPTLSEDLINSSVSDLRRLHLDFETLLKRFSSLTARFDTIERLREDVKKDIGHLAETVKEIKRFQEKQDIAKILDDRWITRRSISTVLIVAGLFFFAVFFTSITAWLSEERITYKLREILTQPRQGAGAEDGR